MIPKFASLNTPTHQKEDIDTLSEHSGDVSAIKIDLYMALADATLALPRASQDEVEVRTSGAKNWYEKVLMLDQYNHRARLGLIRIALGEGEFKHALIMLEDTLKLDPLRMDVLLEIAKTHYQLKHYEEAAAALQKIQVLQPHYPPYLEFVREIRCSMSVELARTIPSCDK